MHHLFNRHEFEQALGVDEGQGSFGVLQSMRSQRIGHERVTEQQQQQQGQESQSLKGVGHHEGGKRSVRGLHLNERLEGKEEHMFCVWQVGFLVMLAKVILTDPETILG